ncbi:MAG: YkgJ family cysteine cluster protein [Planctomycetes bacterium]|nr:YkgJ family cysteine cluster protein [Planctomycetota bacterium]
MKRFQKKSGGKAPKTPWYSAGLRFACLRCGDCCRGEPGFVWVTHNDINAISESLDMAARQFEARYVRKAHGRFSLVELDNGDCIFWSREGCKIYAVRPLQCRTFPFWPEYLRSAHAWGAVQKRCPAIGTGKLHSIEEITQKLRQLNYDEL